MAEAKLAVHLWTSLQTKTAQSRAAVITSHVQQASLLQQTFSRALGRENAKLVKISSVDTKVTRIKNHLLMCLCHRKSLDQIFEGHHVMLT